MGGFSSLETDARGKLHRKYLFEIAAGGVTEQVQCRYSTLRSEHNSRSHGQSTFVQSIESIANALCSCAPLQGTNTDFPPMYVFWDMNKDHNAQLRARELQQYLTALLNKVDAAAFGAITMSQPLHAALGCSSTLSAGIAAVGRARHLPMQQHEADRDFAQCVNSEQVPGGQAARMLFPRPLTFELLNKSSRRVAVKGPGGLEWFELFGSSDFSLFRTLSGEPLLALRRQPRCLHYEYNLERRTQGGGRVPLCSITRERHLNPFRLPATTVQLFAPSFGGPITCQGQWLENFVLIQDGVQACTVRWQRPLWSTSFCYDVVIAPQRDVLLFLGLACAIDCIDQTMESETGS